MTKYNPILLICTMLLISCSYNKCIEYVFPKEVINNKDVLPLDSNIKISLNFSNAKNVLELKNVQDIIWQNSKLYDRDNEYSNLNNVFTLNQKVGLEEEIKIDDKLFLALKEGIKLTKLSKGIFNLAMGQVYDMWNPILTNYGEENSALYKLDEFDQVDIDDMLQFTPHRIDIEDYIVLNEENKTVKLNKCNTGKYKLDFEQMKRGLALDEFSVYSNNFSSCSYIDIDSSSYENYGSSSKKKWEFSIKNPSFEQFKNGRLMSLEFDEKMRIAISSDMNKHYVVKNDDALLIRSNVLDGRIGKAQNYYRLVALFSKDCPNYVLDVLSSVVFSLGGRSEVDEMVKSFEEEYKCKIDYILVRPYNTLDINSYDVSFTSDIYSKVRQSSLINSIKYKEILERKK